MPRDVSVTATAGEIARQFSYFSDKALTSPVVVTKNGRARNVILSYDEYLRLLQGTQTAFKVADAPEDVLEEIEQQISALEKESNG